MAGVCANCASPHSTGASYCWQCGQPLLAQVDPQAISG
jgi:predicted amidophosphoribosyltransferase